MAENSKIVCSGRRNRWNSKIKYHQNRTEDIVQEPEVRAHNFDEVSLGYNEERAVREANRCLSCKNPKCVSSCPVGVRIPKFISAIREGDMDKAVEYLSEDNSLPAVCGRVCPQEDQCEGSCILGVKGEPVSIGRLERYVGDYIREKNIKAVPNKNKNGYKVAVVGSGPAGIACSGELLKFGYDVTIYESLNEYGGVLAYGIPEFRLPKQTVLKAEIEKIENLGAKFEKDTVIGRTISIDELFEKEKFDAVFVGSGAGLPNFLNVPGENLNGVYSANEILTRTNLMKGFREDYATPIKLGDTVAVVGAGNVAMDAARTALRLGSRVIVVYRRSEEEAPARVEELHHAKEEGIEFCFLTNPIEILGDEKGNVKGMKVIKMELGAPDENGRRRPVEVKGSEHEIEVQTVIMSVGTSPNPLISSTTEGLDTNKWGCLVSSEEGATTREGVFAGGDAVTGAATVILAMGAGKTAAKAIDEYIKSKK